MQLQFRQESIDFFGFADVDAEGSQDTSQFFRSFQKAILGFPGKGTMGHQEKISLSQIRQ